ncbi:MAG: hypothetical protein R3F31_03870 [Verrucomicrobiales bacterium]
MLRAAVVASAYGFILAHNHPPEIQPRAERTEP